MLWYPLWICWWVMIFQLLFLDKLLLGGFNSLFVGTNHLVIRSKTAAISETRLNQSARCDTPPAVPNTMYTPLDIYPEGTEIYYQCTDSYITDSGSNNRYVCTRSDGGELIWSGELIQCQASTSLGRKYKISLSKSTFSYQLSIFFGFVHLINDTKYSFCSLNYRRICVF